MELSAKTFANYVKLTKPRIVSLLVFTSFAAMIVASHLTLTSLPLWMWFSAVAAITLGCAGCNAITCYLDRDIDAIMERTVSRPLPSAKIDPPERVLYFGFILVFLSLALAIIRNTLSFVFMLLGILDNVVVYSLLLKRKHPLNIVLGGISGGLPVAFGWAFVENSVNLTVLLMTSLVVLWIPNHIWSLALRYKKDYSKAGVPMLPVVLEDKETVRYIASTSFLLVAFSTLLYFLGSFGLVYLVMVSFLNVPMVLLNLWLLARRSKKKAWIVFKFSSRYLAMIFLAMIADALV
jgi:protoheme IX farnesyltransferase